MYDWMHLYVVGGLLDEEMGLLMYAFHACKAPTTYAAIGLYVTTWFFPKRNSENFASAFDCKAAKQASSRHLMRASMNLCTYALR